MILLRRVSSLNNLKNNNPAGQVATIFILIMAVLLIFMLATINIGNISTKATKAANAADSSALYLASQLATRSHYLWEKLDNKYKYCVKGGLLPAVLAIAGAIIGLFTGGLLTVIALAALGGAIGGAIVYGDLKGAAMGAVQGAAIGLAIYGGAAAGASIGGPPGLTFTLALENLPSVLTIASAAIGAAAGAAITGGVILYNRAQEEKNVSSNMATFARMLQGLPEYESTTQGALYQALLGVVEDPNYEPEAYDFNHNGEVNTVSVFDNWWYNHLAQIKSSVGDASSLIEAYFSQYLIPMYGNALDFLKEMDRMEIECSCAAGPESPLTEVMRRLKACSYNIFWQPGPDKNSLLSYYDCESGCLEPPSGFDDYDSSRMHLEEFTDYVEGLLDPDTCGLYNYDLNELDKQLRNRITGSTQITDGCGRTYIYQHDEQSTAWDWFDYIYYPNKPSDTVDHYDILNGVFYGNAGLNFKGMEDWKTDIEQIRDAQLPGCQLKYGGYIFSDYEPDAPYCDDYPPVYSCNWTLKKENRTGPYFPNPACKINKAALNGQLNRVISDVMNLEDLIKQKYFSQYGVANPCGRGAPGCSVEAPVVISNVRNVRLQGSIHAKCSKTGLNTGSGALTFDFDYTYTCRCCVPAVCPAAPTCTDPDNRATCSCGSSCCTVRCGRRRNSANCVCIANNCCTTQVISHSGTMNGSIPEPPDMDIPAMDKASFLNTLNQMQGFVTGLEDDFATIDEDDTDEFKTVLETLENELQAIEDIDFFAGTVDFYNKLKTVTGARAVNGAGCVEYPWQDYRGKDKTELVTHSVRVETGPFVFPDVIQTKSGNWLKNKKCVKLINGKDNTNTWIDITCVDPGEKSLTSSSGGLGLKWNPFFKSGVTVRRKSTADWNATGVGIGKVK